MEEQQRATKRSRDEDFYQLVSPEIPVLLRVARALTAQRADAEDLVQDTLVRAYLALDRFDGEHPRAWLFTILRNTERNRNRGRRRELLCDTETQLAEYEPFTPDTPEGMVVDEIFDTAVSRAFHALPDHQRAALVLVDIEGLTYAEAAQVLDVPPGTVTSRLHRGRAQIRHRLARVNKGSGKLNLKRGKW